MKRPVTGESTLLERVPVDAPPTPPIVSIVVPMRDDEERIGRTLKRIAAYLGRTSLHAEVLVVDDGSRGEVQRLIAPWTEHFERLRLVRHGQPRGPGAAVRSGVLLATGRFVIVVEIGLAAPIEDAGILIECLQAGADVAIASRVVEHSYVRSPRPPVRRAMEACYNFAARAIVPLQVRDLFCGQIAFRRAAGLAIGERARCTRSTWAVEWVALAEKFGLQVIECPVRFAHAENKRDLLSITDFTRMQDLWSLREKLASTHYRKPQQAQDLLHKTNFVKLDRSALFGTPVATPGVTTGVTTRR